MSGWDDEEFTESEEPEDEYDGKYPRLFLRPGHLYYEQPNDRYFFTPDGEGCIWFDTLEEALEEVDPASGIIVLHQELSDF